MIGQQQTINPTINVIDNNKAQITITIHQYPISVPRQQASRIVLALVLQHTRGHLRI
jgi:hypothetical protein